jgi:hypothetical protein
VSRRLTFHVENFRISNVQGCPSINKTALSYLSIYLSIYKLFTHVEFHRLAIVLKTKPIDIRIKMAAAALTEAERRANHIISLPKPPRVSSNINPQAIAQQWLTKLEAILSSSVTVEQINSIFHDDSYWRDHIALQWDFRTIHSATKIASFLQKHQPLAQLSNFSLQTEGKYVPHLDTPENGVPGIDFVASMFHFDTKTGRGSGILRLTLDGDGKTWKSYAVYTSLQELKGVEEPLGPKRVYGTLDSMPNGSAGGTWKERREKELKFEGGVEPTVLIVGAGTWALLLLANII